VVRRLTIFLALGAGGAAAVAALFLRRRIRDPARRQRPVLLRPAREPCWPRAACPCPWRRVLISGPQGPAPRRPRSLGVLIDLFLREPLYNSFGTPCSSRGRIRENRLAFAGQLFLGV